MRRTRSSRNKPAVKEEADSVCVNDVQKALAPRTEEKEEEEKPVTKKRRGGVKKCEASEELDSKVCVNDGQKALAPRTEEKEEEEKPVTKKRRGGVKKYEASEELDSKVCVNDGQKALAPRTEEKEEEEKPVTKKRRGGVKKYEASEELDSKVCVNDGQKALAPRTEEKEEEEKPVTKKRRGGVKKYEASEELDSKVCVNDGQKALAPRTEEKEEEEKPVTKKRRGGVKKYEASEELDSKEVVKKIVMKGKVPVDAECKAKLGKAYVYNEGTDVYNVFLNQTNLQFNNNKYYLIQLLKDEQAPVYSVWMRWGRQGKVGQNTLVTCGGDLAKAKDIFKKKFFDKTKNEWTQRANFEKVSGKYDLVFIDYSSNEKDESTALMPAPSQIKPSQLDVQLQSLMELICDIKAMEECVLEMKFDIKKAPLGKLTMEQIRAGYSSLKRIEQCLKKKSSNKELVEACNQFYTRIPHDFGFRSPPIIRTEEELKEKMALLEALSDIEIAVKIIQSESRSDENLLDKHYRSLKCHLQPLDPNTHGFKVILKYLELTHAATHENYTMTVLDIFSVERDGEKDNFQSHLHNRMLLWHGSRLSNWFGILSQGLRVAPPEAPVTGYMFGKGIYFADMSSKSANYCHCTKKNNVGLLLLSEVALGNCNELLDADCDAAKLASDKHSVKALGQTAPNPEHFTTLDGVTVPMGPGVKTGVGHSGGYTLLYNEFVVYNPAQIRMKYLLRIQFNYSELW